MQTSDFDFVIDSEPTVEWPVTVRLPQNGGRFSDFRFTARIRVYSEAEYEHMTPAGLFDEEGSPQQKTPTRVLEENAEILPKFIVGWSGVRMADGMPVPIEKLSEMILSSPYGIALSAGLWRAVFEVRFGLQPEQGATLGNSAPSPAAGLATAKA